MVEGLDAVVVSDKFCRMGSYIILLVPGAGGRRCVWSPFTFWYINVRLEFGELVVPVKEKPNACEALVVGEPVLSRGERGNSPKDLPGEVAAKDIFRLQFGINSGFFAASYSCSV